MTAAIVRATILACSADNSTGLNPRVKPHDVGLGVDDHAPCPAQKTVNPLDSLHAPGLDGFERAHEHFVKSQAVRAIFRHDRIGIDHVAAGSSTSCERGRRRARSASAASTKPSAFLTTWSSSSLTAATPCPSAFFGPYPASLLVAIAGVFRLSQDHPLIDQLLKRLGRADEAAIKKHLVPEPAVEQVQHGVLGPADVKIHGQPVSLLFRVPRQLVVVGVDVPQIVPARAGPLRHRVGLAPVFLGISDPLFRLAQGRLGLAGRFEVLELGQVEPAAPIPAIAMCAVVGIEHDRKRLAPVPLA